MSQKKFSIEAEDICDLETILVALGAKRPFLNEAEVDSEGRRQPFTKAGAIAYKKLAYIVYTIAEITEADMNVDDIIETLDDIACDF